MVEGTLGALGEFGQAGGHCPASDALEQPGDILLVKLEEILVGGQVQSPARFRLQLTEIFELDDQLTERGILRSAKREPETGRLILRPLIETRYRLMQDILEELEKEIVVEYEYRGIGIDIRVSSRCSLEDRIGVIIDAVE